MEETDILPQRNRKPSLFAVVYKGPDGTLRIEECPSRPEAKKYIQSLPDPMAVLKIYKVSDVISLKQKVVYTL